jgi:DNA topoisomerase-3
MRLFIAEKPSVAKAIAEQLGITHRGDGFLQCGADTVSWCFGHMLELAEPDAYTDDAAPRGKGGRKLWRQEDLPIIPARWLLVPRSEARKQLATLGRLLKAATVVVHAGDPDREGQLLIDEVLEHFVVRAPTLRFWVSAQDPVSIRRGLAALADNQRYRGLMHAARARQRADWLVGMNLSRAYTLKARRGGSSALLTVGRVQTPTLALVVGRDRTIEAFVPQPYFVLRGRFEHSATEFVAVWKPAEEQLGLDEEGRLIDAGVARALVEALQHQTATVISYEQQKKRAPPPPCFSLSDITVLASRLLGCSADEVLGACQALYETHRLTTYPRTDSGFLPTSQHADAPAVLSALRRVNPEFGALFDQADPRRRSPTWNDAKVTAHHGIVPTQLVGSKANLSELQRRIYELVVRRYIAQFLPDHEYEQTNVALRVVDQSFAATGRVVLHEGWRAVDAQRDEEPQDKDERDELQTLPRMKEGDLCRCNGLEAKPARTKPPARFTEGTLVRAMERIHTTVTDSEHRKILREGDGIGTSATRATILTDLKRREFLVSRGKHLVSTPLGRALIDALPESVRSPSLTALYERYLRAVEAGEAQLDAFVGRQESFVRERVAEASTGSVTLPSHVQAASSHKRPKTRRASSRKAPRERGKHP